MTGVSCLQVIPIPIEKEIDSSDDLAGLIASSTSFENNDILVVAQKIVSKQEDRTVDLSAVKPSLLAQGLASQYGKDPRITELILSESKRIVRLRDGIIIVETHDGLICANAGIDQSNVKGDRVTLLPQDPDGSAKSLRSKIFEKTQKHVAVVIADTFGRAFRMGQTNCAIGISGLNPILDYEGKHDIFGNVLRVTAIAVADELASAAELVMQKTLRCPAAIIRDYQFEAGDHPVSALIRQQDEDLFR